MPYQIQVGSQVVEFPDSVGQDEAQRILSEQFPATGEDIAGAMQDPAYKPSVDDYLKFEEFSKNKQTDWVNTIAQSVDAAAGMISGAISEGAQGAVANPLNYIEGAAQGTRQLYGLVAQSQDPASPLFKFKDLVAGTGSPESRYNQFLDARDFANTTARLERGEEGIVVPPEYTNPEFVQGVSMILDPTLALPGIGEIFGAGKLATRAVGKGAQLTGRAVAGVARPLERFAGAAERLTAEAVGVTPEALRSTAATAGLAGAIGIAPEVATLAAIPAGIRTAREAGEAFSRAGENLMTQPSRIGPLEAIGAAPGANLRQRMLGVVGQYGGDAALDASLRGIAGGIEGAAVGAGLGFLSGGEEGAAAGVGSGLAQGAAGALGARGFERLTGRAAKEARAGDLGRFIDGQQDPTTKALFERVRDTHGVDAASALMDLQGLVRGKFGDVDILYRSNAQMAEKFGDNIRGVQFEQAERPTIFINADIIGKGTGDGPLYTLGHELFHALEKTTQLEGGATEIKDALVGRWVQEGDITRKLTEGAFNDAEIEARFNEYRDKLAAGSQERADQLARYDTIDKKAGYVASELAAEHFAGLLAGQKPDALLKGFSGITRQLLDSALTQNASRALADAAATIERTFGVKPTDSVLFPDLKQASPQVNAMLRDLLRARRKLDERITIENEGPGKVLKPQDVSNPIAAKQLVDLGVAEKMPDGSVRNLSDEEIRVREEKDTTAIRTILEGVPGARVVDGEILGRFSPQQLSAIEQSQAVSSRMKDKIRAVNAAMDAGNSIFVNYGAATRRVKNRQTGKFTSKYNSGIRLSQRELLPYSFYLSKADNPVIKAIDISKIRGALDKLTAPDGGVAAGLWDNVDGFMSDLAAYFTNLDAGEGARRSAEIFGLEKAKFLGDFVNEQEKGGRKFVRDFRLDRIGSTAPMDFRARISEDAIQKSKMRWMPTETIGDKLVTNSDEGYRIVSGAKHRLYGPDGKLIGIYDTQTQAERKADATQARLQPEVDQQQRLPGNEGRQTAEAGGGDRALGGAEGQGQVGTVRQAGDVVIAPDSETFTIPKADIGRFMPASDKVKLEDYADRKIIALAADRMGIGEMAVGPTGAKRKLSVLGQGGRGFMNIFNGGGWAFSDQATADRFISRLKKDADPNGNVIVGITVQSPINHLKNQTGQLAYIEAMQAAIDSKTITKKAANSQIAAMSSAIVNSTAKSIKQSARDKFSKINSLADLKNAVQNKQLNFADMEPLLTQMQRKALPITAKELTAAGISPADIARDIADPELADVPFGSVVALLGVNVKQAPEKTGFHYSYPWTIHGETIGYLDKFYNISDLSTEKRIRNAQGIVTAQPLQTVMPVMDNIINTIKTKQGIPSVPSERFMPSSLTARDINAIAAEVGGGDVKGGAKAFGAFMRSMRDKGITLRDVVKSYGITLSSIQRQELPVSTIKKNWPDAPFAEGTKVRPEDAFAQLLGTPEGQQYLNAAERGVFDEQAADAVVQKFRSFGFHNKLKEQMKTAVEQFYPKAQEIIDAVNSMPTDKFIDYVRNNFKGISYGKVGFWSGQLGRGDIPTFDSRQGKLVYGKEVPVTKQVLMEQKDRLTQLGIKVPAAFKDFAQTLLHHEVWDRLNQSDTEHGPIKEAMLRYMPSDMASGRGVNTHREAMDLFEKGYRIYGAPYDGMEDPIRLKKIDEIENYDPENLWAVPSKKIAAAISVRNMPASDTDYLSAVKAGDTATAQRMVDEAAKAAGYTIGPVYHGTPTGGFNVFDKRMRGETSGVSRQAFSFTTDKKAAEGYSKRLGDEAVRLDAGLRVANDAMRMFDEDVAAQEYFSSKGYSSVDDGMLPEFDWGSIDDVPEFIKELRGYAKDLKPINKRLSDSFIEAAKVMTSTKAVPEVKRVFLRIPEGAPVFQATPQTLGQVMSGFSAENQPTKAGIVELPGNERIYYVADSSQVKLVDAITKDDAGNIIPLSQRFKATSEDIRYMPQPDSAMPGAYSFPGGYRAIPGKAKGSLRLYGPAGSLIGIASSLEEAQRIIRRKTRP
jgi:hypothetical protein